jgi:hypothetical protein
MIDGSVAAFAASTFILPAVPTHDEGEMMTRNKCWDHRRNRWIHLSGVRIMAVLAVSLVMELVTAEFPGLAAPVNLAVEVLILMSAHIGRRPRRACWCSHHCSTRNASHRQSRERLPMITSDGGDRSETHSSRRFRMGCVMKLTTIPVSAVRPSDASASAPHPRIRAGRMR